MTNTVTFSTQTTLPISYLPSSSLTGDFNADGKIDLAVSAGSGVYVHLGDGLGNFSSADATSLNLPYGSSIIATGDFNGDGKADFAVTSGTNSTVYVFLNNGSGVFSTQIITDSVAGTPKSIITGDFNRDGKIDLAMAASYGTSDKLFVYTGNGQGAFSSALISSQYGTPMSMVSVDFNNDGNLDILQLQIHLVSFRCFWEMVLVVFQRKHHLTQVWELHRQSVTVILTVMVNKILLR